MFAEAQKNPALLQVFVNTVLGETWALQGEAPEWQRLYDRREDYRIGTVPKGGLFLTAGVDIQKDRIELEVVAWGRGKESWSVDYQVLEGQTAEGAVWQKLTAVLNTLLPDRIRRGAADCEVRDRLRLCDAGGIRLDAEVRRRAGGRDQGRLASRGSDQPALSD